MIISQNMYDIGSEGISNEKKEEFGIKFNKLNLLIGRGSMLAKITNCCYLYKFWNQYGLMVYNFRVVPD